MNVLPGEPFDSEPARTDERTTESAPARSLEPANVVIGHYHLLQKIGEGGMGEVWLAEQKEPVRRRVALKLVKAGMNTREVIGRHRCWKDKDNDGRGVRVPERAPLWGARCHRCIRSFTGQVNPRRAAIRLGFALTRHF
jgi:hypothetical protein